MAEPASPAVAEPPPETLDELYDHAPCGYLTTRRDGIVVRVNATLLDLLGTRTSIVGSPVQGIMTAEARVLFDTNWLPMLEQRGVLRQVTIDLACSDGRRLPASTDWRRIDDPRGGVLGYRVTVVNRIERLAYEVELRAAREHARQQGAMLQALEDEFESRLAERVAEAVQRQKMESLGHLTGGVAHDFNNLLTPILITLDLLKSRYVVDERALRMTASALSAAQRARVLITRLLAFARRQHLKPQAVDLRNMAEAMAASIVRLAGPHVTVQLDVAADLPPARVDPGQLDTAVYNLCVNACDAMPHGGVLTVAADAVTIGGESRGKLAAGRYVRLSIGDSGTGMSAETLRRAPEPFYTTKIIGKGTGLGLSMVHGFAAQSGGALTLESTPNQGTKAVIWLPADEQPRDDRAAPVAEPQAGEADASRVLSILLVDDDELVRFATGEMLADLGHTVIQAASGAAALTLLREHDTFNLLITDYLMPNMTGVELARTARLGQPNLPVLLVTGYANINDVDGGGLPRLAKPFSTSDLSAMIADTLGNDGLSHGHRGRWPGTLTEAPARPKPSRPEQVPGRPD